MNKKITRNIVVIYHGDCLDGFSAAWSAWKKFGNSVEYLGVRLSTPPPRLKGKEIYTLDMTYPLVYTKKLISENKRVTSIDHHESSEEAIRLTRDYLFDNAHSGAVLGWLYFHPNKKMPKLFKYIEDIDLWRFKLSHSKELASYLHLQEKSFKNWSRIVKNLESPKKFKELSALGKTVMQYQDQLIKEILKYAELVEFKGHKVLAVNSPVFNSQIGNILAAKHPPFGIIWRREDDRLKFSLRGNGKVDVSKLAEKFGGGGHRGSAGFAMPINSKLPWKKLK